MPVKPASSIMASMVSPVDTPNSTQSYYAPATISRPGHLVHVSGQVGTTTDGKFPASYESQIHLALLNLRGALIAAGARVTDITRLTFYVVNYDPSSRLHARHIQKLLGSHRPAMTLVPVAQLAMPGWLFEIDAVAMVDPLLAPAIYDIPQAQTLRKHDVDVIVIGAGLSGLTAARDVTRAGLSCIVLEARDRVGGKTWSKRTNDGKGVIDLGAAWINDTNQSRMVALARQYGADLIEQNTQGECVFQDFDGSCSSFPYGELPPFNSQTKKHLAEIRDTVEAHCQKVDTFSPKDTALDSITFKAYLQQIGANPIAVATASIWTRAMLGQEPEDISALYFLNYCKSGGGLLQMRSDRRHGAQFLRIRQGTQFFSISMAQSLPKGMVQLQSPVQTIRQDDGGVEVTSNGRTIFARKVILSVPTPVYKTIKFTPQLSFLKTLRAESYSYGYYTKVMLVFKTPFWVQRGFCGLAQSFIGPASVIRDTSSPRDNKHVLTCFLAADFGRQWSQLPADQQKEALLEQVSNMFTDGVPVDDEFVDLLGHEWSKEQYSGWGCPCTSLAPGALDTTGDALREPMGNVHFVGTETAGEWKGYMEGAVRSGERGAAEVISDLLKETARL